MRIVRFLDPDGRDCWGRIAPGGGAVEQVEGDPFAPGVDFERLPARELFRLEGLRLLPPARPTKILGIGRNFRAHAAELGNDVPAEPLVFLKAPSSLLAPEGTLLLPPESSRVDYEGELALVVGRRVRRLPASRWREAILGFTIVCDVTARDLQKKDVQFARAKSFDGFCPLGPWIETDWQEGGRGLRTRVDGKVRQDGRFDDLIFGLPRLVEHLSAAMTLEPGDLVLTGTPEGVAPLAAGECCEVEIDGLGTLRFRVENEKV
jgi:2-keto-4-pentenoate hydratase/2-oxohepta-3-ene-1,7-dioic acid hydratase in catechol pathway